MNATMKDPLLTPAEVANRLHVSKRTLFKMVSAGEFPQPMRRNRKWVRWLEDDVSGYLGKLRQQRDAAHHIHQKRSGVAPATPQSDDQCDAP